MSNELNVFSINVWDHFIHFGSKPKSSDDVIVGEQVNRKSLDPWEKLYLTKSALDEMETIKRACQLNQTGLIYFVYVDDPNYDEKAIDAFSKAAAEAGYSFYPEKVSKHNRPDTLELLKDSSPDFVEHLLGSLKNESDTNNLLVNFLEYSDSFSNGYSDGLTVGLKFRQNVEEEVTGTSKQIPNFVHIYWDFERRDRNLLEEILRIIERDRSRCKAKSLN